MAGEVLIVLCSSEHCSAGRPVMREGTGTSRLAKSASRELPVMRLRKWVGEAWVAFLPPACTADDQLQNRIRMARSLTVFPRFGSTAPNVRFNRINCARASFREGYGKECEQE